MGMRRWRTMTWVIVIWTAVMTLAIAGTFSSIPPGPTGAPNISYTAGVAAPFVWLWLVAMVPLALAWLLTRPATVDDGGPVEHSGQMGARPGLWVAVAVPLLGLFAAWFTLFGPLHDVVTCSSSCDPLVLSFLRALTGIALVAAALGALVFGLAGLTRGWTLGLAAATAGVAVLTVLLLNQIASGLE